MTDEEEACTGSTWTLTKSGWTNPVHQHKDGTWWFADEVWADEYGPYASYDEADAKCSQYVKEYLRGTK